MRVRLPSLQRSIHLFCNKHRLGRRHTATTRKTVLEGNLRCFQTHRTLCISFHSKFAVDAFVTHLRTKKSNIMTGVLGMTTGLCRNKRKDRHRQDEGETERHRRCIKVFERERELQYTVEDAEKPEPAPKHLPLMIARVPPFHAVTCRSAASHIAERAQ